MDTILPIARLDNEILIITTADVPFIGKERALEVMCVQVDLKHTKIYPIIELEKHLKFNPWEKIPEEQRAAARQEVQELFSEEDFTRHIVQPLSEHRASPAA